MPEEESKSKLFVVDRRKERRISVNLPIEVTETDDEAREVTERTFIEEDVSDLGCRFSTYGPARKGSTVAVRILGPNGKVLPGAEPRLYEIMWVVPKKNGHTVGARLRQGEKLTPTQFPLETSSPKHDRE